MTDKYQIYLKDNMLIFRTSSFKAEKGSVLHSGIYNRELASALLSGAIVMLVGFFFALKFKRGVFLLISLFLFVVFFIAFRTLIFLEPLLDVAIDKEKGIIIFTVRGIFKKKISYSLQELVDIKQGYISIVPENPDGIKLVEQVALQHGTVIPGFGTTSNFYTVELEFKDGLRFIIFSSEEPAEAEKIAIKFKNFIME
jgi:hypothetical protein